MPTRVIQSGLPGIMFDDSNASQFIPAVAQASNTLLDLGPRLAQIRMQQTNNEREAGFKQQELGMEGRRIDMQGRMIDANVMHTKAQIRGQAQKNAENILNMGGGGDIANSEDWQQGFSGPNGTVINPEPIIKQAGEDRAIRVEGEKAKNNELTARAGWESYRPEAEQAKVTEKMTRDQQISDDKAKQQDALNQRVASAAVDARMAKLQDIMAGSTPEGQAFQRDVANAKAINPARVPSVIQKYRNAILDDEMSKLDPTYKQRKIAASIANLNAMAGAAGVK